MDDIDPEVEQVLRKRAKAALRQRLRALRNTLPESAIAARSARVTERLCAMPELAKATRVALFWPIEGRNEVDLRSLDAWLRERGATVAYPWIDPETKRMTFRRVDAASDLVEKGLGFREPNARAPELEALDTIVVPALAVDPLGHRIGYGAGFYDRALPRFAPPATTIAVAFDFQVIAEVPIGADDVAVTTVVTDARTITSGR